jgi:hypothetical protein
MLKRYDYTISVYCIREDRDEIMAMLKRRLARRVQPTTLRFHCVIDHVGKSVTTTHNSKGNGKISDLRDNPIKESFGRPNRDESESK